MADPVTVGLAAGSGVPLAVLAVREVRANVAARGCRSFRLVFPYGTEPAQVIAFTRGLAGLLPPWWKRWAYVPFVVLEVQADAAGIRHRLVVPAASAAYVLAQLRASLPGVRLDEDDATRPEVQAAAELQLSNSRYPLRSDEPEATAAGLLATLQPLKAEETVVVQWVVSPAPSPRQPLDLSGLSLLADLGLGPARLQATLPASERAAEREKNAEPAVWAVGRIGARAGSRERARALVRRVEGAFHVTKAPGVSLRRRWLPDRLVARRLIHRTVPLVRWPTLLNARELAAVAGLPMGELTLPGLTLAGTRQLAPSPAIPRHGRVVGRATFPGAERPLALSVADSLRHLHVIGPTGVGKSTLLLNLIAGDIAAGRPVIVVDPKGDLIADVLSRAVPAHRVRDVVLLDPTDSERPLGFNPLVQAGPPELAADAVVSIFRGLYTAFWGPRTDDVLRSCLLTLIRQPGMTLAEVPVLLSDESFRRRLTGDLDDYVLEGFWAWYEALSPGERAQVVGPLSNKLRAFLLRPRLRRVIGQSETTFSLEEVLTDRRILLVNLAKGVLGEDAAALLGATIIVALWQAVQTRAALPPERRTPVFCFIDEFQDYLRLPTSLADVLAQARAYGFGLTLAHQHLGQLPAEVRHGVAANARSRVTFQTAADDARVLAREVAPYLTPADLQGLGPYEAVLSASAGAHVAPPVTMATLPPPPSTGQTVTVRALSRQRYGRDAAEVDAALRARVEGARNRTTVGTRRRS